MTNLNKILQHVMEFLKKSWANMVEKPDNPEDIDNDFQLVVSKQANKKTRAMQKHVKEGPSTRVGAVSFSSSKLSGSTEMLEGMLINRQN